MAKKEVTYENALSRCASLCTRAEHSAFELERKMRQWGVAPSDADKVIAVLEDGGFVDNERFAMAFAGDKYRFDGWGRIKIRYALRQHKIPDSIIRSALDEIDEKEYEKILMDLLKSKLRSVEGREPYKQKAALFRYASSRGFELSLVAKYVSSLVAGAEDFDIGDFSEE